MGAGAGGAAGSGVAAVMSGRRSRVWRVGKWVGVVLSALIGATYCFSYANQSQRGPIGQFKDWTVFLSNGALSARSSRFVGQMVGDFIGGRISGFSSNGLLPTYKHTPATASWPFDDREARVPLGPPLFVIAVLTAFSWGRDRRRFPAGHCRRCGYDLTKNESGRCPECGVVIAQEAGA